MNRVRIFLWSFFLLLLLSQVPIFVQQTLTPDTVLYDLQAKCLLNGGVLYRDVLEPNLPGIVWIHAMVRSVIGWCSPAFLLFDLFVVAAVGMLLGRIASCDAVVLKEKQTIRAAIVAGVMLFYLGTSEWCHCQRDTWMLLPCLLALKIRIEVLRSEHSARSLLLSLVEGILWAVAFWIKPFVAVPALAVLLASLRFTSSFRVWIMQTIAVLLGGLLTGAAGIGWMISSDCWSHFIDTLMYWNGDYFQAGRTRWTWERYVSHAMRFQPWILLHIVALFVSFKTLRSRSRSGDDVASSLLVALYLGWISQAFLLQQLFDYIHVPGILLALTISVRSALAKKTSGERHAHSTQFREGEAPGEPYGQPPSNGSPGSAGASPSQITNVCHQSSAIARHSLAMSPFVIAFTVLAIAMSPMFRWQRQRLWVPCVQALFGTQLSPEAKDQLAQIPFPRWNALQPLLDHIREKKIADKTLMAYNGNLIHLYPELGFHPTTRFVYLDVLARSFPDHREEMISAVEESAVLYVVSDLREDGFEGDIPDGPLLPTSLREQQASLCFPYNQTPIFRSGGYVLFRIDRPVAPLSREYLPLATP